MHPILGSRARLGAYLLGWAPVAGLLASFAAVQGWSWLSAVTLAAPLCFAGSFMFLSSWYLCRAFPLEREYKDMARLLAWGVSAVVMSGMWTGIAWGLMKSMSMVALFASLDAKIKPSLPFLWIIGTLLYLAVLALHYLLVAQAMRGEAERQSAELRALAREAELKALRAQLNPHFLFNSLNSISALTTVAPSRAREMCVLLSDFFRKSLKLGQLDLVLLKDELELVRTYLAIEQVRFGSRLQLKYDIEPGAESILTPPLLLQPLAENAIKHGIGQILEGGELAIRARRLELGVEVVVSNPVDADLPAPRGLGLGLATVRQRLQGRFGAATPFEAKLHGDHFRVRLVLPSREDLP